MFDTTSAPSRVFPNSEPRVAPCMVMLESLFAISRWHVSFRVRITPPHRGYYRGHALLPPILYDRCRLSARSAPEYQVVHRAPHDLDREAGARRVAEFMTPAA